MNRSRPLASCAALLALPLVVGCVPTVAWTPDGESLVYTENGFRRLVRYDLKTRTRTVLVEDTGAATVRPAVSPDGKHIALANVRDGEAAVDLVIYDLAGKRARVVGSGALPKADAPPEDNGRGPFGTGALVAWSADGHVIVNTPLGERTWIFDARRGEYRVAVAALPWLLSGSPIGPEGGGFLTMKDGDKAFVTWDGKRHRVDGHDLEISWRSDGETWPQLTWDGHTARFHLPRTAALVSTKRRKVEIDRAEGRAVLEEKGLAAFHAFPGSPTRLCVYLLPERPRDDYVRFRVEFQDVKAETRRVLVAECFTRNPFSPSPDGRRVAVRVTRLDGKLPLGGKGEEMLVVDEKGEVLARFDVFTSLKDYGEGVGR